MQFNTPQLTQHGVKVQLPASVLNVALDKVKAGLHLGPVLAADVPHGEAAADNEVEETAGRGQPVAGGAAADAQRLRTGAAAEKGQHHQAAQLHQRQRKVQPGEFDVQRKHLAAHAVLKAVAVGQDEARVGQDVHAGSAAGSL
jgi:hypothetical protein